MRVQDFDYIQLPPHLREVSKPFAAISEKIRAKTDEASDYRILLATTKSAVLHYPKMTKYCEAKIKTASRGGTTDEKLTLIWEAKNAAVLSAIATKP